MRTPRTIAGRKAKVALLLATVTIACTAATCASTGTRGRQTAAPTILSAPNPATALAAATFVYTTGSARRAATGPDGSSTAEAIPRGTFSIDGGPARPMAPGVTQPLDLVITNANDFAIEVSRIAATVQDATTKDGELNGACVGSKHMSVSRAFTGPVVVPAKATRSLSQLGTSVEQWPLISMLNLTSNQDACKDTIFELTYAGTVTR